jgi:hypothetical protein
MATLRAMECQVNGAKYLTFYRDFLWKISIPIEIIIGQDYCGCENCRFSDIIAAIIFVCS